MINAWGEIGKTLNNLYSGSFAPAIDMSHLNLPKDFGERVGKGGGLRSIIGSNNPLARFDDGTGEGLNRTEAEIEAAKRTPTEIGTMAYRRTYFDADTLTVPDDPSQTFADATLDRYELEVGLTDQFERDLIQQTKSQALVDTAQDDIAVQQDIAQGIVDRQRSRYGMSTTEAFRREEEMAKQRGGAAIAVDALNNARITQKDLNTSLLNTLSDISNQIQKTTQGMGSTAAGQYTAMENAYRRDRAQHKANKYGIIGSFIGAL